MEILGVQEEKITRIYCSINEDFLLPPTKSDFTQMLKNRFGDRCKILYSSGAEHRKNLTKMFECLDLLPNDFMLILTGKKMSYQQYFPDLDRLEKQEKIYFLGFLQAQELIQIYQNCDMVIFPSLFEGFGYPLVEAMAVKKPVVCSDIEIFREIGGDYPRYFDPHSVEEMKAAIMEARTEKIPDGFVFPEVFLAKNSKEQFKALFKEYI